MRTLLLTLKSIAVRCGFLELIERQGASVNRSCIAQRGLVLLLVVAMTCPVLYADFTFGEPVNLRTIIPVLDPARDFINCLSYDGLEMYIHSGQDHDTNLRVLRRESKDADWEPPQDLGPIVNTADDSGPSISADGLKLYFNSNRPGGYGSWDIYMSTRTTKNDPWGPPVNLGPKINGPYTDVAPRVSPDGAWLYWAWCNEDWTVFENFRAPILPIVDFNADGAVDVNDLAMLIDNWGMDNTLYDIGPYAWGDGKVDIEDLKVFMAEWEKETSEAQP